MGRKVLANIIFPLVKRKGLYGEYYHQKKVTENRPGNKAMTIVMRNFLRKFIRILLRKQDTQLQPF